jgi:hypothetical protein
MQNLVRLLEGLRGHRLLVMKPSHTAAKSKPCCDDDCASEKDTHFSPHSLILGLYRHCKGSVFGVGPHVVYKTVLMHRTVLFNFRNFQEFDAENRFEGNVTTFATTVKF